MDRCARCGAPLRVTDRFCGDCGAPAGRRGDTGAAGLAIAEAREIAVRLRCQPLLGRAADMAPAEPKVRA